MKKKVTSIICIFSLLCAILIGCGASPTESAFTVETAESYDFSAEDGLATGSIPQAEPAVSDEMRSESLAADSAEKIIYTANVVLETKEFDSAVAALDKAVEDIGGFVENSEISGDSSYDTDGTVHIRNRRAYYTVRVPAGKLDAFLAQTGGMGNVISNSKSAQNVASQYTDYEARLTSLNTQETRLLELIAQADSIDALITLEDKLSEVRYEIESIQRSLNDLDSRIVYSTVDLSIREVEIYKVTASAQRTFSQRMGDAFKNGWKSFVRGLQNICVAISGSVFTLLMLAVIGGGGFLIVRAVVRKKKSKKSGKSKQTMNDEE